MSLCDRLIGSGASGSATVVGVPDPSDNERGITTAAEDEPKDVGADDCLRKTSGILGRSLGIRILKLMSGAAGSLVVSMDMGRMGKG